MSQNLFLSCLMDFRIFLLSRCRLFRYSRLARVKRANVKGAHVARSEVILTSRRYARYAGRVSVVPVPVQVILRSVVGSCRLQLLRAVLWNDWPVCWNLSPNGSGACRSVLLRAWCFENSELLDDIFRYVIQNSWCKSGWSWRYQWNWLFSKARRKFRIRDEFISRLASPSWLILFLPKTVNCSSIIADRSDL